MDKSAATRMLYRLLDAGLDRAPEYGPGFSTHLPMALQALHALGATAPRLHDFAQQHVAELHARPVPAAAAEPHSWHALRGQGDAFEPLQAMFALRLQQEEPDTVLAETVPALLDGVAGGAFHGLIRTAHAVAARHEGELSMGLAYWAARHAPLAAPNEQAAADLPLADWLAQVQWLPRPQHADADAWSITRRMQAWSRTEGFGDVAPRLLLQPGTLDALARTAAGLYAATEDFTVLHMVTACQAMRQLQPWWGDEALAMRHFSIAAAAALRASDVPPELPPARATDLAWPQIIQRAIASDDEHVVKLVQACRLHEAATGAPEFRWAAGRAVGG
ncbi:questin oxidase family protein [Aquincola sp. J276]|uniref:questin oxidase family protein n=1 Tax=Aquincola sp. J276 TaxID=2898432 RepID=UPI0021512012|nr:questin oxidase family protein [Aquincola sp. J276]MCR5866397.1 questin oxidase family protein [Aquincola sp. J276]